MTHQGLDWQDIFEETVGLSVVITVGKANPGKLFFSVKADTTKQTHCHEVCFLCGFQRDSVWSHVTPLSGLLEVTFGDSRLHIEPRDTELVLSLHSTFSLLCYGDRELVWEREGQPLAASLEHRDGVFVSNLTLRNVTGHHTGEYTCTYSPEQAPEPAERRALYIYVPGREQHILACGFSWGWATRKKRALAYCSVSKHLASPNPFSRSRRAFMVGLCGCGMSLVCQLMASVVCWDKWWGSSGAWWCWVSLTLPGDI